jgi:predicted phage-related endonuclease
MDDVVIVDDVTVLVVPEHYVVQVQHQLMVSGAEKAHLWVFEGQRGVLHAVERDEAAMTRIREGWDAFQPFLDSDTPPPLSDTDTVVRSDSAWAQAARAFSDAKQAADSAAEALEQARNALVALAQHPREQGAGVSVTRYWKAGNVDYKKVPQLHGVDLATYRGKSREEIRVTLA